MYSMKFLQLKFFFVFLLKINYSASVDLTENTLIKNISNHNSTVDKIESKSIQNETCVNNKLKIDDENNILNDILLKQEYNTKSYKLIENIFQIFRNLRCVKKFLKKHKTSDLRFNILIQYIMSKDTILIIRKSFMCELLYIFINFKNKFNFILIDHTQFLSFFEHFIIFLDAKYSDVKLSKKGLFLNFFGFQYKLIGYSKCNRPICKLYTEYGSNRIMDINHNKIIKIPENSFRNFNIFAGLENISKYRIKINNYPKYLFINSIFSYRMIDGIFLNNNSVYDNVTFYKEKYKFVAFIQNDEEYNFNLHFINKKTQKLQDKYVEIKNFRFYLIDEFNMEENVIILFELVDKN